MTLTSLNIIFQVLLAIVSLFFLRKDKSSFVIILTVFLSLTAIVESSCFFLMKNQKPTFIFHLVYSLFEYGLIFWMYYLLISDKKWLIFSKFLVAAIFVTWLLVFFKHEFFFLLIILGSLNTAILGILYLRELLLSDKILNYKRILPFWVSVGFLVFYLPSIPFFSLLKYMRDRGLFFIISILIILRSIFIIYGLLCSNKEKEY